MHRYEGRHYLFVTLTSADPLPTPPGRPPNVRRGTEILVADRPEGPFTPFGHGAQTPHDWMALDGTLAIEDGVPSMVFAREWIQVEDGTMELMPLTADLTRAAGAPVTPFRASDAPWTRCRGDLGELFQGRRYHASITDGPWVHAPQPLWSDDGGHPMLFRAFDDRLVLAIHQPNRQIERARFFEIDDSGNLLRIVRELARSR